MYYPFALISVIALLALAMIGKYNKDMSWSKWCFRRKQITITWAIIFCLGIAVGILGLLNNHYSQLCASAIMAAMLFVPCSSDVFQEMPGLLLRQGWMLFMSGFMFWMWCNGI